MKQFREEEFRQNGISPRAQAVISNAVAWGAERIMRHVDGVFSKIKSLLRNDDWNRIGSEMTQQGGQLSVDSVNSIAIICVRKIHVPHKIPGYSNTFESDDPLVRGRHNGRDEMAIRSNYFGQVF